MALDITSYLLGKKAGGGGEPINLQEKEVEITENGEQTIIADYGFNGLSKVEITTNVSGPAEIPEKDVNFYDYDGTRVYSYDKDEFLALEELPANPTHEGLLGQGWNWTYQQMMDYVRDYGICDVGQMYTTSDGYTRIYFTLEDNDKKGINLKIAINGTANIDWGDNSEETTKTGTSLTALYSSTHIYSEIGDYVITIKPQENAQISLTGPSSGYTGNCVLLGPSTGYYSENSPIYRYYRRLIKRIEVGNNTLIGYSGIDNLPNLEYVTLPTTIMNTNFQRNFNYCRSLKNLVIPNTVTRTNGSSSSFVNSDFDRVILPNTIDNIQNFTGNVSIRIAKKNKIIPSSITVSNRMMNIIGYTTNLAIIPPSVTTIGNIDWENINKIIFKGDITSIGTLAYAVYISMIDLSNCTSVPTLTSITVNNGICDNVIVPDDLYDDWIVADVWSSMANRIIKKSDWEAQQ